MDYRILVNRDNPLDESYVPLNLVKIKSEYKDNIYLEENTYQQFLKLKEEAKKNGYDIDVMSGYRDYVYQEKIFNELVNEKGYNYAYKYIAKPGCSEHQTGLAVDVVIYKDGKCYIEHDTKDMEEMKWVHTHAHLFGFVVRYLENKEEITKYNYEPWHLRYVGNVANYLYDYSITLEEYHLRNK